MRVRVVTKHGSELPTGVLNENWNLTSETTFPLTVGEEYAVHALTAVGDVFWYYVLDDHDLGYPVWYPAPLFAITDDTIPSWWAINYIPNTARPNATGTSIISFKEWATDKSFYERLVDGDAEAAEVFRRERNKFN